MNPPYPAQEVCQEAEAPASFSSPALIEDAENGDNQVVVHDGRNGLAYTVVDPDSVLVNGSATPGRRAVPLRGGPGGSRCAWNLRGKLRWGRIFYAGLGMNMLDPKAPYDASRFLGITFLGRNASGSDIRIRVHLPDGNTDPDGNVCSDCFNDFGKTLTVRAEWTRYTLRFDSLEQLPEWGQPRPAHIDPSQLYGIQFRVMDEEQTFDIWIDDIAFIEANQPGQPAPPSA